MKWIKYLVLIISVIAVIGQNQSLFAKISSRVEGVVTDKDSGQPIEGARVVLCLNMKEYKATLTDSKGRFNFENVWVDKDNKYYLNCSKRDYVPLLPKYYSSGVKYEYSNDVYRVFSLAEGQIKHVKINLEKGGTLKGILLKRDTSGISPFKDVTLFLKKQRKPGEYFLEDIEWFIVKTLHTDENGAFLFENLEPSDDSVPDEYVIELDKSGYVLPVIGNIKIKKGEETRLDYTVEYKHPPVLIGTVKINGKPPVGGSVMVYAEFKDDRMLRMTTEADIDKNGNYQFQGLFPGRYEVEVNAYYTWNKKRTEIRKVEIVIGETQIMNFSFEVEQ